MSQYPNKCQLSFRATSDAVFHLINCSHVPLFSFYKINELTSERINLLINWLLFVICAGKCISETPNITRAEFRPGETLTLRGKADRSCSVLSKFDFKICKMKEKFLLALRLRVGRR